MAKYTDLLGLLREGKVPAVVRTVLAVTWGRLRRLFHCQSLQRELALDAELAEAAYRSRLATARLEALETLTRAMKSQDPLVAIQAASAMLTSTAVAPPDASCHASSQRSPEEACAHEVAQAPSPSPSAEHSGGLSGGTSLMGDGNPLGACFPSAALQGSMARSDRPPPPPSPLDELMAMADENTAAAVRALGLAPPDAELEAEINAIAARYRSAPFAGATP